MNFPRLLSFAKFTLPKDNALKIVFVMKKYILLASLAVLFGGCTRSASVPAEKISREAAVRLYAGGIDEAEWLKQLNVTPRKLETPDAYSVRLHDGFLFYKTASENGVTRVTDVIPAADAPESLKSLARSFRKSVEAPKEIWINKGVLMLDGTAVSEEQLEREAERLQALPRSRRPICKIYVGSAAASGDWARIASIFKKRGLPVETSRATVPVPAQ